MQKLFLCEKNGIVKKDGAREESNLIWTLGYFLFGPKLNHIWLDLIKYENLI